MSTVRNPVPPVTKPSHDDVVAALRNHLEDDTAEMLARRYLNADESAKDAVDWPTAKRRILK